jgi:hypothetical protein
VVGTVEEYASTQAIRDSVKGLIAKPTWSDLWMKPVNMTVTDLCQHFQQRELEQEGQLAQLFDEKKLLLSSRACY